jgi:hypothetical protein
MPSRHRPLRPGDVLRAGRGLTRYRLDEDYVDFLRVHFDTEAPGLGHVVEILDDGMVIQVWGHLFTTPELATAPHLRPLNRIERLLAPQRLGEFILRREVRAGRVVMDTSRSRSRQWLMRLWLRRTRADLPILEALGGRIRPPVLRRLKSRLFNRLARLGIMPGMSGALDHGMLIDRIGVTVELAYSGRDRGLWLDRILLHKNHSIHLVGIDRDNGEQRTFRLDRVTRLSVPPLGEVEPGCLYWELQSLCRSREGWLWSWNRHQADLGRPPGPAIGPLWRAFSRSIMIVAAIGAMPGSIAKLVPATYQTSKRRVEQRLRALHAACRRLAGKYGRRETPTADMPSWRRRLLRAITTVEAGGVDQISCLLPMNGLRTDARLSHAYLRHLMELTLADAMADPAGHPLAPQLLTEALALASGLPRQASASEWRAAFALLERLRGLQPGMKRISIHATRRAGRDSRLLLCECFLNAVYDGDKTVTGSPNQYFFYRTSAHFIARWDDLRYRVDASSAPRLKAIADWWDTALAARAAALRKTGRISRLRRLWRR